MNKLPIKVVLFDFIGTTVIETQADVIGECFRLAFHKNGVQVEDGFIQMNRGRSKGEVIKEALPVQHKTPHHIEAILNDFDGELTKRLHNFKAAPDVEHVYEQLRQKGFLIALATGLTRGVFEKIIHHLRWDLNWFAYQATYEEIGRGRPQPDLIYNLMDKLKIANPTEILKIGDTQADIQEGKNAGTLTAAILSGTQPEHFLTLENPDYTIRKLIDILSILP